MKPAFVSTCSAAAVLLVVGMVADVTGPAQAWKVGSVSPPDSVIGARETGFALGGEQACG